MKKIKILNKGIIGITEFSFYLMPKYSLARCTVMGPKVDPGGVPKT